MRFAPRRTVLAPAAALLACSPFVARAQTGFYDLDAGRPLRTEDALVVDRYTLEVEPAPLRAERLDGGRWRYRAEPHVAFGVLPRTQIEIGVPLEYRDVGGASRAGLLGVELSGMHSFNNERLHLPALALWAGVRLPTGALAPSATRFGVKGLLTRTFAPGRLHLNVEYTTTSGGSACQPLAGATTCTPYDDGHVCFRRAVADASCMPPDAMVVAAPAPPVVGSTRGRWAAGVAADHTIALKSLLVGASAFAQRDARAGAATDWTGEAGLRWQLGPRTTFDAGLGRHFTGADRSWSVTTGLAFELPAAGLFR